MGDIIYILVAGLCISLGLKTRNEKTQNMIFSRYKVPVKDEIKYNKMCGNLIIGFGIAAGATLAGMNYLGSIWGLILSAVLILEIVVVLTIYRYMEKKMLKR